MHDHHLARAPLRGGERLDGRSDRLGGRVLCAQAVGELARAARAGDLGKAREERVGPEVAGEHEVREAGELGRGDRVLHQPGLSDPGRARDHDGAALAEQLAERRHLVVAPDEVPAPSSWTTRSPPWGAARCRAESAAH